MKKFTLLVMLFVASMSFGQLKKVDTSNMEKSVEIGKIQPLGQTPHMELTKLGNTYTFTYKDVEFKTIDQYRKFTLNETGSDLETLYQMIMEGYEKKPVDPIMLELTDNIVWLRFEKSFGMTVLKISSTEKYPNAPITQSNMFTKKQVEKLFGKK